MKYFGVRIIIQWKLISYEVKLEVKAAENAENKKMRQHNG